MCKYKHNIYVLGKCNSLVIHGQISALNRRENIVEETIARGETLQDNIIMKIDIFPWQMIF